MGCEELIGSLRRSGDEKIRLIWEEAEAEAEKIQGEFQVKITELHADYEKTQLSAVAADAEKIISAAAGEVRKIHLSSQASLSARLLRLVAACLPLLRNEGYEDVFSSIVKELPRLPWQRVRVNPADVNLAKEYFSAAEIVADETIAGGVDAMVEAGKIRVINTFEKRLERAWVDILPGLIQDIHDEVSCEGSPSES